MLQLEALEPSGLITAPVATRLIQSVGVLQTFWLPLNCFPDYFCGYGLFKVEPPAGWATGGLDAEGKEVG